MERFLYRKAEISDVPILIEATMQELLEDFPWDASMQALFLERYEESIPRLMGEGTEVYALAYQGAVFAGMGRMYIWGADIEEGTAVISGIYIMPDYRGQGALHGLFSLLLQEAKERGCVRVRACEENGNRERLHKLGFQDLYEYDEDGTFELSQELELPLESGA